MMTLDRAELWLEKVFNSHVVVLHVLACASCNVTNVSIHRLLIACVVFVQMSLLLEISKSLPDFRFQISWCIVNSVGVVGHVVLVVVLHPE